MMRFLVFLFELLQLGEMALEVAGVGADELVAFADLHSGVWFPEK